MSGAWRVVAAIAICWALAATLAAAYYYNAYLEAARPRAAASRAMLVIDYGNGTIHLYNVTLNAPPPC